MVSSNGKQEIRHMVIEFTPDDQDEEEIRMTPRLSELEMTVMYFDLGQLYPMRCLH